MTWLHFILWITGIYCLYYPVIVFFDLKGNKARTMACKPMSHELSFAEPVATEKVALPAERLTAQDSMPKQGIEQPKPEKKTGPDNIASGGVTMKSLFNLVREEAILYTQAVNFQA